MSAHNFRGFSIRLVGLSSFGSLALQSVIHDEQHKVEEIAYLTMIRKRRHNGTQESESQYVREEGPQEQINMTSNWA